MRRLEQIVAADDVGVEDGLPRPFDREAAEMHDAVDAGDHLLDLRQVGEIGRNELLVGREIAGPLDVAEPQAWIDALEQATKPAANAAGGSRDENGVHVGHWITIAFASCNSYIIHLRLEVIDLCSLDEVGLPDGT
jgi:hypothetical protein